MGKPIAEFKPPPPVKRGPGRPPKAPTKKMVPLLKAISLGLGTGLQTWFEYIGEDVLPRSTLPTLVAWAPIGMLIGEAMSELNLLLVIGSFALFAFTREYAPAFIGGFKLPLPPLPRGAMWWPAWVLLLGLWPLWWCLSANPLGSVIWVYYLVASVMAYSVWQFGGPPRWAALERYEIERWRTTAEKVGLGPDSRLLDIDEIGVGYRYKIDIGHAAGKTVEWYMSPSGGKIGARFAALWRCGVTRVDVRDDPKNAAILWVTQLSHDTWTRAWPHPVVADPRLLLKERSVLEPMPILADPLTGELGELELFDGDGARHVAVIGKNGSGKSNLLNVLLLWLTMCFDVEVDFIDPVKGKDARRWRPLLRRIAVQTGDPTECDRHALEILREAKQLIISRALTNNSAVFKISREHKARVILMDEVSALLGSARQDEVAQEARALVQYITTKGRSEMVCFAALGQRFTMEHIGTQDVKVQAAIRIVLAVSKRNDQTDMLGKAVSDMCPDMSTAARLAKGAALVVADARENLFGRVLELHDLDILSKLVDALVRLRTEQDPSAPSADDEQWLDDEPDERSTHVWVASTDGRPVERLALTAHAEPLADEQPEQPTAAGVFADELPEQDSAPRFDATSEAMFYAAVLRSRPPELFGIRTQNEIHIDGVTHPDFPWRLDFYVPGAKLAIEIDGAQFHNDDEQRIKDKKRDDTLWNLLGIHTVRYAARDVFWDADALVRDAVTEARARVGSPETLSEWSYLPPLSPAAQRAWSVLQRRTGDLPIKVANDATEMGDTMARRAVTELIEHGLLVDVINPSTRAPYQGKARKVQVPRITQSYSFH